MSKLVRKKSIQKSGIGNKSNTVPGFLLGNGFAFIAIVIISLIVFSNSISKIFIALDDQVYISDNPFIKSISWQNIKNIFTSFYNGNYHPFTTLLFAIEYKLFGNDASYYHVISLILHIVNSFLVYVLIDKLISLKGFAIFGSLIFAIHPMHVESVVWISEQKDVLYSFFFFAGLIVYIKYIQEGKFKNLFFVLLLFIFSLFSKPAAVIFPLILILFDIYLKRGFNKKISIEKIPFFIFALIFGVVSIFAQNSAGAINNETMVHYVPFQRIFVVCYAIVYYIYKFIIPIDLCVLHYAPKSIPFYYYLSPLILFIIGFLVYKAKEVKKSLIFGLLFYFISIILVVQIIPIGFVLVSERYSYVSYFGLIFVCGSITKELLERKGFNKGIVEKNLIFIFTTVILIFSYISIQYIKVWQDNVLLLTDITVKNSQSAYAFNSLGKIQNGAGNSKEALQSFGYSIKLDSTIPEAYFVRANIYFGQKQYDLALSDYRMAEKLKPLYLENLNNLAFLYSETGKLNEAIIYYGKAISVKPSEYLYQRRATCYTYLKNYTDALEDYNKTIELNPFLAEAYSNRGVCFFNTQQAGKACEDWKKASSMGNITSEKFIIKYCK